MAVQEWNEELQEIGERARAAERVMRILPTDQKNEILRTVADVLVKSADVILEENKADVEAGRKKGMHEGLIDRLMLTPERIESMAEGLVQIASLEDPIGEVLGMKKRPNGLLIGQMRVPLGVVGMIYEARPNVTADAFGLCFKTGNAVILKGGSDAICSNIAIVNCIRAVLEKAGVSKDAIQLIRDTDRSVTTQFMKMRPFVDVLIPRGSAGLIRSVVENSKIPVIETGTGNCHIYVDESADLDMAVNIIFNAKTQRIGVCNACESLVVHVNVLEDLLPRLKRRLDTKNVQLRGDETARQVLPDIAEATEEDWGTEYLDYILSIKTVSSIDEAIDHINTYNTGHSEAIVTRIMPMPAGSWRR